MSPVRDIDMEKNVGPKMLHMAHDPGQGALTRTAQAQMFRANADGDAAMRSGNPAFDGKPKETETAIAVGVARQDVDLRRSDELGDTQIRRVAVDAARIVQLKDVAVHHDGHAVRHGEGFRLVVRHIDEGGAERAVQFGEFGAHVNAQSRIEVRQRLVHQERQRLAHHGPAESRALALSAGKLARLAVKERIDLENARRLINLIA